MSHELKEPLVLEGLHVLGRGNSGKPLGSFSGLPCPVLGVFYPLLTELFGVPRLCPLVEPGAQDRRVPALRWGETPTLLPVKLYPEIFSRQPHFSVFSAKMESERETQGSLSPKLNPSVGSEGQRGGSSRVESLGPEALLSPALPVSHSRHGFDQDFERKF